MNDIGDFLTEDLKKLFKKDLEIIEKDRSQEVSLLKNGLATESRFLKGWGYPTDCSYEECDHDTVTDARCWLEKQQHDQKELIEQWTKAKGEKQAEVDKHKGDIAALEERLTSLIDQWKAFPGEVKKAWETVEDLKKQLEDPNLGPIKREMLETELAVAEERLKELCGTADLEKPEDCGPAPGALPHEDISQALEDWRTARTDLRDLVAGAQNSLEAYEVDIKKAQKKLEYMETYKDVLIAKCIQDPCASCESD
jgi:hypothetical protein